MQALKAAAAKKIGLQVITQAAKETRPAAINPQTNFVVLFFIVIVPVFILAAFQFFVVYCSFVPFELAAKIHLFLIPTKFFFIFFQLFLSLLS